MFLPFPGIEKPLFQWPLVNENCSRTLYSKNFPNYKGDSEVSGDKAKRWENESVHFNK